MSNCRYCEEFEQGAIKIEKQDLGNCVLFESKNFVVFPSLGQIVEGYLLIAPKKHFISMGGIPANLYPELERVRKKVKKVLTKHYGAALFFEHGPISQTKKGGCCVEHAHFHAVPAKMDIFKDLAQHFRYTKINSYKSLKQQFLKGIPYLFLEDNSGQRYLFPISIPIPSQYIRKIIAKKIGDPNRWDWKTCLGLAELKKTVKKLKKAF